MEKTLGGCWFAFLLSAAVATTEVPTNELVPTLPPCLSVPPHHTHAIPPGLRLVQVRLRQQVRLLKDEIAQARAAERDAREDAAIAAFALSSSVESLPPNRRHLGGSGGPRMTVFTMGTKVSRFIVCFISLLVIFFTVYAPPSYDRAPAHDPVARVRWTTPTPLV